MQVRVQKSTTTACPRSLAGPSGSELSPSVAPPSEGRGGRLETAILSPPPREREGNQDDHDEPAHRHPPPCGVESHEVGAAARFRPEVVPAPPAVVGAFDLIFTVRTGEMMLFGDPSVPGSALR